MLIQPFELLPFISKFAVIDWRKCKDYKLSAYATQTCLFFVAKDEGKFRPLQSSAICSVICRNHNTGLNCHYKARELVTLILHHKTLLSFTHSLILPAVHSEYKHLKYVQFSYSEKSIKGFLL